MWLQKMPFIVKLLLYVIVFLFLSLFIIVALSLMSEPEKEEVSGWAYMVGFILSLIISVAGGISIESNGLHRIREQASAMKSNIRVIGGRIENTLLQLDPVVEKPYNAYAAQYNSGVKSFPVCLLRSVKKEPLLEYYKDPADE